MIMTSTMVKKKHINNLQSFKIQYYNCVETTSGLAKKGFKKKIIGFMEH